MKISVRFFGQLKEISQVDETDIQIKRDTLVEDLVWILGERFPNMRKHLKHVSFSIGNEYAPKGTALKDGDVVGVLPPISGG